MKKSIATAALALSLGFAGFVSVPETHAEELQKNTKVTAPTKEEPPTDKVKAHTQVKKFHEGDTPVKTVVNEKTGVVLKIYNVDTPETPSLTSSLTSGWDYIGMDQWYMNGNFDSRQYDKIFYSTGGDYMVRIPAHTPNTTYGQYPYMRVELWDDDGAYGDDLVAYYEDASRYWGTRDYVFSNIGGYVDGEYAEFYTVHQANYTLWNPLWASYYD